MNQFNAMPSAPCKLYAQINSPFALSITVKDTVGANINLSSGYTADMYILPSPESDLTYALIHLTETDGLTLGNGFINILIPKTDMDLVETDYYYFLIVTPTSGIERPYLEGWLAARYSQLKNAGVITNLSLVVNSQPAITLLLSVTSGYTQSEVNALLANKIDGGSGNSAAMAVKQAELIAAGYVCAYFYYNTTDHLTYTWNGSELR